MQLFWGLIRIVSMGRRTRIHFTGAVYHAMARGVDGRAIFIDDDDRVNFLSELMRIARESGASVLAYCLMGNHFHLAMQVGPVPLAVIMQRLLTGYALTFNQRHNRTGHLFQARYKAILCRDERYLAGLIRYIHLNPVRARLVERPQDWPWSSLAGGQIADDSGHAEFDPWPKGDVQEVCLKRGGTVAERDIDAIGEEVALRTEIDIRELRSDVRRRPVIMAKRLLTQMAMKHGHSLTAVARWLHASASSLTRYARANTENTGRPDTNIKRAGR